MGEVIALDRPTANVRCECGSEWWDATVIMGTDGQLGGYALPMRCHECGRSSDGG